MSYPAPMGPAAGAEWEDVASVRIIRDAAHHERLQAGLTPIYYAVPARPSVARASDGRPVFSLTLVLSRSPAVHEESVHHLIQQGILTMDVALAPGGGSYALDGEAAEVLPLFVRQAAFTLEAATPLAEGEGGGGTTPRVSLQATLTRAHVLDVLDALEGRASQLRLTAAVAYRACGTVVRRLSGEWAAVHDFMSARLARSERITREQLQEVFASALRERVLAGSVSRASSADARGADQLFDAFLRQSPVIFRRQTPDLAPADPANLYSLRARPAPGFRLEHEEQVSGDVLDTVRLEAPLDAVLGGLLSDEDRDRYIRLLSLTTLADSPGVRDAGAPPRPQRLSRAGGPRWPGDERGAHDRQAAGQRAGNIELAVSGGVATAVALRLRPDMATAAATAGRNAQAMIASGLARPLAEVRPGVALDQIHWYLDDWRLEKGQNAAARSLPVVVNASDPVWPDRLTPNRYWYAPGFTVLTPDAHAAPESSPFQFAVRRIGETPSGPALEGSIRFTLRRSMSAATRQALAALGATDARAVPLHNLSVSLVLPFVNSNDNQLTRHTCACSIVDDGTNVTASVSLATDWVRVAYTLLSTPAPQSHPARLSVAFSFETYTLVRKDDLRIAFGSKEAAIPLVYSAGQLPEVSGRTYVDVSAGTLNFAGGALLLQREAPGEAVAGAPAGARASATALLALRPAVEAVRPGAATAAAPASAVLSAASRPAIRPGMAAAELVFSSSYALRTLLRQDQMDVLFPCNTLGAFYRETVDGDEVAVGCRQAMQLGQVSYRQYERIPGLDHAPGGAASYTVYRSLQQPGRFLLLPARYAITRHSPGSADAYRPRVLLYSDEDPERALRTPIVFTADLQPDVPAHARRELETKLALLAKDPAIDYPTAIECDTAFTFHAMETTPVTATRTPDSLTVSIACSAADWPLLFTRLQTGGVVGLVRFGLGDGTELTSNISMDLRHVIGPWAGGAVQTERAGETVRVTNRIERPVDVHELVAFQGGERRQLPVELTLAAGGTRELRLDPAVADEADLYAVYTTPSTPVALSSVPNAIEHIRLNILFTNQIRFSNHGLAALTVFARRVGTAGHEQIFVLPDTTVTQADFLMPLTEYVQNPVIELRTAKTFDDGRVEIREWFEWDVNKRGLVISLTWELVQ